MNRVLRDALAGDFPPGLSFVEQQKLATEAANAELLDELEEEWQRDDLPRSLVLLREAARRRRRTAGK